MIDDKEKFIPDDGTQKLPEQSMGPDSQEHKGEIFNHFTGMWINASDPNAPANHNDVEGRQGIQSPTVGEVEQYINWRASYVVRLMQPETD